MSNNLWASIHKEYETKDWIDKPSIFAQTVLPYLPQSGKVLELGAGQGQDSRYFAENGYTVVSTDLEEEALQLNKNKLSSDLTDKVTIERLNLSELFPYESSSFDVVYAHLSLHYFDSKTSFQIIKEIWRVLKPGGVFAFFVNSTSDPEYGTGTKIEEGYFEIGHAKKRYFSVETAREFTKYFDTTLLDNLGETYKDSAKGVHNLVRFIGTKPTRQIYKTAIPFCAAIVERDSLKGAEVLIQTRWQPGFDTVYTGTLEFPAGVLDKPYEDIHEALAREIKEETGLELDTVKGDQRTDMIQTDKSDGAIGFRPFCATQQLKNGKPWVGLVFVCTVKPGKITAQIDETRDVRWIKVDELKKLYLETPEKLMTLDLPAWKYYLEEKGLL